MQPTPFLRPATFTALLVGLACTAPAAPEMALNLVWTRVADVNGENGSVESAEFSPDGRFIVTGAKFDNSVVLWRTSDGTEIWRAYTAAEIERVGWSPDGKFVASASEDHLVTLFDATNGRVVKTIPHRNGIDALTWSRDGRWLATGEEHTTGAGGARSAMVRLFKMPEGTVEREVDFANTVNNLAFTSDDRFLVAAGHQGTVRIYATTVQPHAQPDLRGPDAGRPLSRHLRFRRHDLGVRVRDRETREVVQSDRPQDRDAHVVTRREISVLRRA
jgi:dipeptidyl aminopeptidase/acylaminoacyl peptidase